MSEYEGKHPKDKIGQNIVVGSYIAYGHALDRSAALRIGKVLAIKYGGLKWNGTTEDWKITVWGVDDELWHGEVKLVSTKGTLQFPNRIIVLDPEKVPETHRKLLDPLTIESKSVRTKSKWGYNQYSAPEAK